MCSCKKASIKIGRQRPFDGTLFADLLKDGDYLPTPTLDICRHSHLVGKESNIEYQFDDDEIISFDITMGKQNTS